MIDPHVLDATQGVIDELATAESFPVIVTGSHVRGEGQPESDVDLYVIGPGPEYRLLRRSGYLFSVSFRTAQQVRASFTFPAEVGAVVPGWRGALIVRDIGEVAAVLKREAEEWTWDMVGAERCDAYVAESITGLAEEVHKLVVSLDLGTSWTAAVQRSILGLRLGAIMAVHLRLLYGSENHLWDLVAERLGDEWRRAQAAALSDDGQPFDASCAAALELYSMAAVRTHHLLTDEQYEVVAHTCSIAGFPLLRS